MEINAPSDVKITPMMQQFRSVKSKYPDCIIFFRMGDFYEMFEDDAISASKILGIALTNRNKSSDNSPPMCGIPYHSYQPYLNKLLSSGFKVAVCEQLEDPSKTKTIVKRGVTRVITPGTVIDEDGIASSGLNFLVSVSCEKTGFFCFISDVSTGDTFLFKTTQIVEILNKFNPRELIVDGKFKEDVNIPVFAIDKVFHKNSMIRKIIDTFKINSIKSIGVTEDEFINPIFNTLYYLEEMILDVNFKKPVMLSGEDELYIDSIAQRTLEIFKGSDVEVDASLYGLLNRCKTPMGERLLSVYLMSPTNNTYEINERLSIVEYFFVNKIVREQLQAYCKQISDVERIMTRVSARRASPRDIVNLKNSIRNFTLIKQLLVESNFPVFVEYGEFFDDLKDVYEFIDNRIADDAPFNTANAGVIKDGFSSEIDELRDLRKNSRSELLKLEISEKEKTGISTLKVRYNKVFGYYIEVSKGQTKLVPEHYERKQTLVNAERYVTRELKELENRILTAEDRLLELEKSIFENTVETLNTFYERIKTSSQLIAKLDVLAGFGDIAETNRYCRPVVTDGDEIKIVDGRHPVVEHFIGEPFVPNDLFLGSSDRKLLIITGPNMAGKSTYIRMCGIIAIMAHVGSFVPARSCEVGKIDRIFTRIGASDNLSKGESTFMVEMVETGNILSNATKNSLIILDEIGRGTSTFDGLSIAWAITEYILNNIGAKTLFATHYHELSDIPLTNPKAKNLTIEVKEWKNEVIFLRKIIEGSTDRSYGIYVAKLAGLPEEVIQRGNEILSTLEKNEFGTDGLPKLSKKMAKKEKIVQPILVFEESEVLEELRSLEIDKITPLEALNLLAKFKEKTLE